MTSVVTQAAHAAHSVAASLLGNSPIKPGGTIPRVDVKEEAADKTKPFELKGKNVICGVPGAFTGVCHAQIPGYIDAYEQFKAKGVNDIYVVAVNDAFVTKGWKESLAPSGTPVHFIADDQAKLVGALGLVMDATGLLRGIRSKRWVIVAEDDEVVSLAVEEDPGKITVTAAKTILSQL